MIFWLGFDLPQIYLRPFIASDSSSTTVLRQPFAHNLMCAWLSQNKYMSVQKRVNDPISDLQMITAPEEIINVNILDVNIFGWLSQ